MTELLQHRFVSNLGCDDRVRELEFPFIHTCDHLKDISSTLHIHIDYGPENDGSGGTVTAWVDSLHWVAELGFTSAGKSAGRLRLEADILSRELLSPKSLFLEGTGVRDFVPRSPNTPDIPRQLLCPETFIDIVQESVDAYRLDFYRADEVVGTTDKVFYYDRDYHHWMELTGASPTWSDSVERWNLATNYIYCVAEGAVPFVRYRIENPDYTESVTRLRITTERPGIPSSYIEYSRPGEGVWRFDENGNRVTELSETRVDDIVIKIRTIGSFDSSGLFHADAVLKTTYADYDGRLLPIEIVEGEGADARSFRQTFYDDPIDTGRYRKLKTRINPDGSWTEWILDAAGRTICKKTGWLSGGTNDVNRTILHSYTPLFSTNNLPIGLPFDNGSVDPDSPRVETELLGAIPLKKTLRSVYRDTMGYRRIEEVLLLNPSETNYVTAWTDPRNPHIISYYMPKSMGRPCSMLPWLVVSPDGTTTFYDYVSGDYVPGEDGTPGTFTPVQGGPYFRTIATHGTAESFDIDSMGCSTNYAGVPLRTTRDVKLELRTGKREVLRMTEVCNAAGAYETVSWTTTTLDNLGHAVATRSSDGSRTENEWLGDRLVASTGADGIRTTYAYDGLGRRISSTYTDPLIGTEIVSSTTYDAAGRVLASTTTAGGLSQSTQRRYDSAGRLVWSCGPDGIETTTSYGTTNGLRYVATTRGADGLFTTSATYSYADGRTAYVERNGKRAETYEYGYADGLQWTIAYEGPKGTNSPVWTASVSDALGRTISELRPGFGGSILETSYAYNAAGQLLSTEEYTWADDVGAPIQTTPRTPREILALRSLREINSSPGSLRSRILNLYDSLGVLRVSASDVNLNGIIDFTGPDIVFSNETSFAFLDSTWWRESSRYSFPDTGSAAPLRVSTTRTRLSGLGVLETTELGTALLASETRSIDALDNVSTQKSYRNRVNHASFTFSTSASSALSAWSLSLGGHSVSNRTATGILSSRAYDALGRVVSTTDGRGIVTSYSYDERGRLVSTTDATGATTAYGYDVLGRQTRMTNALGLVTTTSYDLDGNVVAQSGTQYPVCYSYDDYGRMRTMTTFRTEDLASGDVTTWHYDEATGLLVFKEYPDGKGPTYRYTPDGLLVSRIWARGIATTYAYDGRGNLINADYSDATPAVSLTYDRLGHNLTAICAGVSTNIYSYNRFGQLTNEVQNGTTITRSYDTLGRETGYAIGGGIAAGSVVSYSYDTLGRFASVSSGTNVFSYSYLPGSGLVSEMVANTGHAWERIYEPDRNLIATVHNRYGDRTISRFDYTNDEIGRRIARVDSGEAFAETAFERYAYNDRSEVIGSQRFYGSNISDLSRPVTGRSFGYGYDPIGNRVTSFEDAGGERLTTTYTANELNQYSAIQNPSAVPLRGDAKREAVVTVNGGRAERDNGTASFTPWSFAIDSDIETSHFQQANVLAVAQSATGEDVVQRQYGSVFAPAEETHLTYDEDGNMTFDGHFRYTWNGENRMILAEEVIAPTNRAPIVITFAYNEQGRMVLKNIVGTNTVNRSLLWDGYNIVQETDNGIPTYNIWGLNLDGTLHGCGGVGGLIAVTKPNGLYYAVCDADGNVSDYISGDGSIAAHSEFTPFGEPIASQGGLFSHQFSTKPYCDLLSMIAYQFRDLNPRLGRWLSRDPLANAYSPRVDWYLFCGNCLAHIDILGLQDSVPWDVGMRQISESFFGNITLTPPTPPADSPAGPIPYHPQVDNGLSYLEGGLKYFFGDDSAITIPISQVGIPTDLRSYIDPCSIQDSEINVTKTWDSFRPLSLSGWKKGGPGQINLYLKGTLVRTTSCCWFFVGDVTADDNWFDFDTKEWGSRDRNPFWIQYLFRGESLNVGNPLLSIIFHEIPIQYLIGYPKESITRIIAAASKILGHHKFKMHFDGSIHIEEGGCCNPWNPESITPIYKTIYNGSNVFTFPF